MPVNEDLKLFYTTEIGKICKHTSCGEKLENIQNTTFIDYNSVPTTVCYLFALIFVHEARSTWV